MKGSYLIYKLKDKSGVALMSVMLLFTVMVLLLGALSFISVGNTRATKSSSLHVAAFYAAEAGISVVTSELRELKENDSLTDAQIYDELLFLQSEYLMHSIQLSDNGGLPVTVIVHWDDFVLDAQDGKLTATIVSTGYIDTLSRTVKADIEFSYGSLAGGGGSGGGVTPESQGIMVRHAVLVRNTLTTGNGAITSVDPSDPTKIPRLATLSTQNNSINLGNGVTFPNGQIELTNPQANCADNLVVNAPFRCQVNNTVLVTENRVVTPPEVRVNLPEIDFTPIRSEVSTLLSEPSNFTNVSNLSSMLNGINFVEGNYVINHLDFSTFGGATVNVNAGETVFIVTNRLTLGPVRVIGGGTLRIYVRPGTGNFVPTSGDFGRTEDEEKLSIIVDTINGINNNNYHVSFPNNSHTRAYIMFENARIQFGQNSQFDGAVYTGAFNGGAHAILMENRAHLSESGGRALLVAPNGRINMSNNSSMNGAVIANDFVQGNGGQTVLRFDTDLVQRIPLLITAPVQSGSGSGTGERELIIGPTIEE